MTAARERYLRLLMVLALVGVVTYETFGWSWVPLFPSTGVLLAGGAALLTAAADRHGPAGRAVRAGLLRLLAPFWLFAAVAVPVMLAVGWSWSEDLGSEPLRPGTAWLWLLPLADPPVSTPGLPWTAMSWFVRVWLWFLLLSPVLLWLARRWPLRLAVLPVGAMVLIAVGLVNVHGRVHDVLVALCVFACCWLLGFGYADGRLGRAPLVPALVTGAGAIAAGLWVWAVQADQYDADDIADVPLATLLLSAGAVLVLFRAQPAFRWLGGMRRTGAVLRFLSDRTVTVVLWAGAAVVVTPQVLGSIGAYGVVDGWETAMQTATTWVLVLTIVVVFGWVERLPDLVRGRALRRRPPRQYVFEGNVAAEQQPAGGRV